MKDLTEEQKTDIADRSAKFLDEYKILTDKYEVGFVSFPSYQAIDSNVFTTIIQSQVMDTKYAPVPSIKSDEVIQTD